MQNEVEGKHKDIITLLLAPCFNKNFFFGVWQKCNTTVEFSIKIYHLLPITIKIYHLPLKYFMFDVNVILDEFHVYILILNC